MVSREARVLATLTTIIAAYGCGGAAVAKPPSSVSADAPPSANAAWPIDPKPDDNPTRGTIQIAQDIRVACGIPDDAAHFAFDSAHILEADRRMLRTLSDCFVSGPLNGRDMSLVGHADSRGPEDYNLALAGKRADNVKSLLVAETMIESKISTTSRGEMDATGTSEASYATDRRVEVYLGKRIP